MFLGRKMQEGRDFALSSSSELTLTSLQYHPEMALPEELALSWLT